MFSNRIKDKFEQDSITVFFQNFFLITKLKETFTEGNDFRDHQV